MSMGVHHPYHLDLCADDEDPSQLIIRPEWDAPHVRCFPRMFCAWPCLLRQVGTVLGSPYDCVVASLAYANPGSRHIWTNLLSQCTLLPVSIFCCFCISGFPAIKSAPKIPGKIYKKSAQQKLPESPKERRRATTRRPPG